MTKLSSDSVGRIGRTAFQAVSAAVLAAPVVIGALHLSAVRASAVEAVVAALVAGVSTAQNIAEDFGFTPPWGKAALPTPAVAVPVKVAADLASAETIGVAAATVEQAAEAK